MLPVMVGDSGFTEIEQVANMVTALGTLSFYRAVRGSLS